MSLAAQTSILLVSAAGAGLLGSLTGLGGGIVIVPLLVLGFGVDITFAVATSLVAVIATSCGSAAAYVRDGLANVRIAILLETATVSGALVGAALSASAPRSAIYFLFGGVALWSAANNLRKPVQHSTTDTGDRWATRLGLHGTWKSPAGVERYYAKSVGPGMLIMLGAGVLSAMIGIGSGIVKVLAMDRVMGLPFKVSTSTSNFMIGVTAAASAGVYLQRGHIVPELCAPVALGALTGSLIGAQLLHRLKTRWLRLVFAVLVGAAGIQMLIRGANA
jgi:uncharacterized membrane protein YfcA